MRAVIDTNVLVSGFITRRGNPYRIIVAIHAGQFEFIISQSLIDELADVVRRDAFLARGVASSNEVSAFFAFITQEVDVIASEGESPIRVRDPKDEQVIATALAGNADYLVTGDNDLLALRDDPGLGALRIVTVAEFLEVLGAP
jgi:putative PIN family toxin of toxin-antitoxin system